jgi:hypothetical protein
MKNKVPILDVLDPEISELADLMICCRAMQFVAKT